MMPQNLSLRKAAVFVSGLELDAADALLEQLTPQQAAAVREAMLELGPPEEGEQQRIADEFLQVRPMVPQQQPPGVELDESLARRLAEHQVAKEHASLAVEPAETPPFRFLHEAAGDTLIRFLHREHPQTVALVVAHLPPQRAADVVLGLDPELRVEVLHRVAELDETDPQVLRDVEKEMEQLLADQLRSVERLAVGCSTVESILNAVDGAQRTAIVEGLVRRDQRLADRLQVPHPAPKESPAPEAGDREEQPPSSVTATWEQPDRRTSRRAAPVSSPLGFRDLEQLDDRALASLLSKADSSLLVLALAGATSELIQRITQHLPARDARRLHEKTLALAPLRLEDVRRAQDQLVELAQDLIGQGIIPCPIRRTTTAAA